MDDHRRAEGCPLIEDGNLRDGRVQATVAAARFRARAIDAPPGRAVNRVAATGEVHRPGHVLDVVRGWQADIALHSLVLDLREDLEDARRGLMGRFPGRDVELLD